MTKPRSDSKLQYLPEEQRAQLVDWLLGGLPLHTIKAMVKENFSVATSLAALSNFYQQTCAAELIVRRQRAVSTADQIAAEITRQPGNFDKTTVDAIQQKVFELCNNPGVKAKEISALYDLVIQVRKLDLQDRDVSIKLRRLELLEHNAADAKAKLAAVASKGGIAPETMAQIEEALHLL